MSASLPGRVRLAIQHVCFAVLTCGFNTLQDPIARAYSAWTMSKRAACRQQAKADPMATCEFPSFAEMVIKEVQLLKQTGCTFSRAVRHCLQIAEIMYSASKPCGSAGRRSYSMMHPSSSRRSTQVTCARRP
jgi:hypothetical protein